MHADAIGILLSVGADLDGTIVGSKQTPPLYVAAENDRAGAVKALLQSASIDVNKPWINGVTPLFAAARDGYIGVVKALTAGGANVDKGRADNPQTPLYIASRNGHIQVASHLLSKGAQLNNELARRVMGVGGEYLQKVRALHQQLKRVVVGLGAWPCCGVRSINDLKDFIEYIDDDLRSALLNMQDDSGNILTHAVRKNKPEAFQILKDNGANDKIDVKYKDRRREYTAPMDKYIDKKVRNSRSFKQKSGMEVGPPDSVTQTQARSAIFGRRGGGRVVPF